MTTRDNYRNCLKMVFLIEIFKINILNKFNIFMAKKDIVSDSLDLYQCSSGSGSGSVLYVLKRFKRYVLKHP
jgi:hypothetical protein